MNEEILLRKPYVTVKKRGEQSGTYGGNQNLFAAQKEDEEKEIKQQSGCGLIALLDLCMYLFGTTDTYEEQYLEAFNTLYKYYGGIRHRGGISGIGMAKCFNKIMKKHEMSLKARWNLSGNTMQKRVLEMLKNDIPVVLCIPRMILRRNKNDRLNLYAAGEKRGDVVCSTNAHYVTVTAIVSDEKEDYYQVASWGEAYFISIKEYDRYMKHHFLGTILGNVLYVQKK